MARVRKGKACWASPSSLRLQPKLYGWGSRTLPKETDVIPLVDCYHSLHSIQYARHIQLVSYRLTWTRCSLASFENKNNRSKEITPLDTAKENIYGYTWFQTFAVLWMLYSFFWAIPLAASELYVPTFRYIQFRSRGITQKKEYNVYVFIAQIHDEIRRSATRVKNSSVM